MMDALSPSWTTFMFLCLTSVMDQNWGLKVSCTGRITLDPGPVVEWGSSLSILCQIDKCHASQKTLSIILNYQPLRIEKQNCSTAQVHISNMTRSSTLFCLVGEQVVCGLDLKTGYQPAKVTQFRCFTQIKSDTINCSWMNGRESHLPTNYSLLLSSVSGSKSFSCQRPGCNATTIPRGSFCESAKCEMRVIAQNALGISTSDPFTFSVRDIEIPNPPGIQGANFTHMNGSRFLLTWSSLESSGLLLLRIHLSGELIWEGNATQVSGSGGSIIVEGLKAMAEYQMEWKVCTQGAGPKCSLWGAPMRVLTPGIAPTHRPDAWRTVNREKYGVLNVTVSWKPMESETFTTVCYELSYWQHGQRWRLSCPVNVSLVHLQVPVEVKELNLTVVTSAGSSPPASLSLTHTNIAAPAAIRVSSSTKDTVFLSWLWQVGSELTGSLLGYVIQWQSKGSAAQWKRVSQDCHSTNISGLKPGWRYDVLLHAETTRGLSQPAFHQLYSEEREPLSGPKALLQSINSKSILVQWEEPILEDQRGFITHYTLYIRRHGTGTYKTMFQVNASSPREKLLDFPDSGFDLCISAWNAAGEGPRGPPVSFQLQRSDEMFIGIWVVAAVPLVLGINLMCLKCARMRIRAACLTVGPAWLFEKFPKVGNSNAIKLLKDERCGSDSLWMSVFSDSDPPISPVEDIPEPIPQSFLFPSVQTKDPELHTTRPEIVDPYKPQWADSCQISSTLLPETPEVEPEEYTVEERPLWACLPPPPSGKDIGLADVTLGGLKGLGISGNFLFPPSLVLEDTEWSTAVRNGMGEQGGFSLTMLTRGQTVLPNDLLSSQSPQINPYSPQECWLKVAHNS